jgi:hypothetical protein
MRLHSNGTRSSSHGILFAPEAGIRVDAAETSSVVAMRVACGARCDRSTDREIVMKTLTSFLLAAALCGGIYTTGCETSHTESDKPTLTGGEKHEETTTTKNPITGDVNTSHTESKTP